MFRTVESMSQNYKETWITYYINVLEDDYCSIRMPGFLLISPILNEIFSYSLNVKEEKCNPNYLLNG